MEGLSGDESIKMQLAADIRALFKELGIPDMLVKPTRHRWADVELVLPEGNGPSMILPGDEDLDYRKRGHAALHALKEIMGKAYPTKADRIRYGWRQMDRNLVLLP